jgi:hypothetical protein
VGFNTSAVMGGTKSATVWLLRRCALGSLGEVSVGYGRRGAGFVLVRDSVRAQRVRAVWRRMRSTTCNVHRAAWHHRVWVDGGWVPVLMRGVREPPRVPQGWRGCIAGWSHQFKRVSLRRAGRCWVGSGRVTPGLPEARAAGGTWVITAN